MNWRARLHFLHRAWRYRLHSEKFGVQFLLGRDLVGRTAVDIGANRGIYSYWMHQCVGRAGRVIAFEPQPELAAGLADLRTTFGLHRLEVAAMGLSAACGELRLRRPPHHWGAASFEGRYDEEREQLESIITPVSTLDDYFRDHDARPVRFIKCDVEGHELAVFQGGQRLLREDRPELLMECDHADDPECAVFRLLRELDYAGYCFFQGGFTPIGDYRAIRAKLHEKALKNFVFLPRENALCRSRAAVA